MTLWDDDVRMPVIVKAMEAATRRFADERDRRAAAWRVVGGAGAGVPPVARVVLMSSRELCDDDECETSSDLFDWVKDAFERDHESLAQFLAHDWGHGPEDADFVSSDVERAALDAPTPDGTPRYSGFISVWRFPTHWIGIGVRDHGTRPPVELVAMTGPLTLLTPR